MLTEDDVNRGQTLETMHIDFVCSIDIVCSAH